MGEPQVNGPCHDAISGRLEAGEGVARRSATAVSLPRLARVKAEAHLGGRAAEQVVFGEPSTGAADDLAKALARDMVLRFGMDDRLGPVVHANGKPSLLGERATTDLEGTSDETARRFDEAVHRLVKHALEHAERLLRVNRALLDRCAEALLAHETLEEEELTSLAAGLQLPADEPLRAVAGAR